MDKKTKPLYQFDAFTLHTEDRLLFKDGEVVPLAPKVFDILLTLVQKNGRVLDKDELIREVWADTFVEEGNLARNVSTLRKALGESEEGRQFIETIPRRGYRFVADVRELTDSALVVRERARITIEQEEIFDGAESTPPVASPDGQTLPAVQPAATKAQTLTGTVTEQQVTTATRSRWWWALAGLLVLIALVVTFYVGRSMGRVAPLSFQQLSFRRGYAPTARFAPDGQTIIYSAYYDKKPVELYMTRPETPESRPLNLPDMSVLAVSKAGEMAVLLKPTHLYTARGTLARMPMTGGAPREVLTNVQDADWSPDGKELAVLHWERNVCRIEYPIGTVLYEAKPPEWLAAVRVSPKGDRIAFLDHTIARFDDHGAVTIIDLVGNKTVLSREFTSINGLAWSPDGDELLFTAADKDLNNGLRAVTLAGKEREIYNSTGRLLLLDVTKDGKVLLSREDAIEGIISLAPNEETERDLSWLDYSWLRDISADGKTILFDEEGAGGGKTAVVYLRKTDGSPAVRLGEGNAMALSPDGKWALAHLRVAKPRQFILYPTGAGEAKVLIPDATSYLERCDWFPDSKRVLLRTIDADRKMRNYICDIDTGDLKLVLQGERVGAMITPDGKSFLSRGQAQKTMLYPLEGGEPRPINGLEEADIPLQWSNDGKAMFVVQGDAPVKIYRLDVATGKREIVKEIVLPNLPGILHQDSLLLAAEGKAYAYGYSNFLSNLFLIEKLR